MLCICCIDCRKLLPFYAFLSFFHPVPVLCCGRGSWSQKRFQTAVTALNNGGARKWPQNSSNTGDSFSHLFTVLFLYISSNSIAKR
ncbi:hypothetical protein EV426DRAFT_301842 [Tirmania nivea]|nr:hypothetical protein EV426DRAFT_301842 [Tirmania nivea]